MTKLDYILAVLAEALDCNAISKRDAAKLLRRCLATAALAPEPPEDWTEIAEVHQLVQRKYGNLTIAMPDHQKAAEVTLELLRRKRRITLSEAKAHQRLHGLAASTFAIWTLKNAGKLRVVAPATYELVEA